MKVAHNNHNVKENEFNLSEKINTAIGVLDYIYSEDVREFIKIINDWECSGKSFINLKTGEKVDAFEFIEKVINKRAGKELTK